MYKYTHARKHNICMHAYVCVCMCVHVRVHTHTHTRGHVNASFMHIWRVLETTDALLQCFCVMRTQNNETQSKSNNWNRL